MISFISLVEIIDVVLSDLNIFLWIAGSVADPAASNSNGIKTLLSNGFITFPITDNPVFNNGPKTLPKNPPVLCYWVFDNFVLAEELFAKALGSFETCVLVRNNLCWKLFLIVRITNNICRNFYYYFVTSLPFFILDFNLLSCELYNSTFKVLYWVILYWYYIKVKWNCGTGSS